MTTVEQAMKILELAVEGSGFRSLTFWVPTQDGKLLRVTIREESLQEE